MGTSGSDLQNLTYGYCDYYQCDDADPYSETGSSDQAARTYFISSPDVAQPTWPRAHEECVITSSFQSKLCGGSCTVFRGTQRRYWVSFSATKLTGSSKSMPRPYLP